MSSEVCARVDVDGTYGIARCDDVVTHAVQDKYGAGVFGDVLVKVEIVDCLDEGTADLGVEDAKALGKTRRDWATRVARRWEC